MLTLHTSKTEPMEADYDYLHANRIEVRKPISGLNEWTAAEKRQTVSLLN